MIPWFILISTASIIMLVGAFGAYFFKRASENFSLHPLKIIRNYYFILAGLLYTIAAVGYVILLKFEDLIIVYPLASIQYVWVMLLSAILLNEKITKEKMFATTLIILGVIIITVFR